MALDMDQLRKMFYEECLENLVVLEDALLHLDLTTVDKETINTIFRAAHSIKGGAATFNLLDISEFTHSVEAYLDLVRNGELSLNKTSVDVLLRSCDCIGDMLKGHEQDTEVDAELKLTVSTELSLLLETEAHPSTKIDGQIMEDSLKENECHQVSPHKEYDHEQTWRIEFIPHSEIFFSGNDPLRIIRELHELDSSCSIECDTTKLPSLEEIESELCYLSWTISIDGRIERDHIEEIFEWVDDECDLTIVQQAKDLIPVTGAMPTDISDSDTMVKSASINASTTHTSNSYAGAQKSEATRTSAVSNQTQSKTKAQKAESSVSSIRVDIDKVDSLINLVGELVITQSMLTEIGNDFSVDKLEKLKAGLDQLLQNSKDLQENVLNIRMLPMSFAFSRFPRLVRDLCSRLDKQVDLQIQGENTELDKTVLERIVDPLVHLVRNGIDHGIEQPELREANGKSAMGVIQLNAFHQGGSIVIEVKDDGAGINCDVLWQKAVDKGVLADDSCRDDMTDKQILKLIFAPGFSTADEVSDISGRGVGMDVVKRNIEELGGHIEVSSCLGKGSQFTISLPLTLAILDGQLVKVGGEVYVIPLLTIIESIQIDSACIKRASGGIELYRLREENIPIVRLQDEFGMGSSGDMQDRILCFVEAAGNRVGLLLDELLDQQQVVIKSLESNYSKVAGISGATILGDGSVSLILDIQGLISSFLHQSRDKPNKGIAA